jgi:hypothetical protein
MTDTPLHEFIFLGVFFSLVFVVPIIVIWASYSPVLGFDVSALWMHQNRLDKFAVIIVGTWWIHSCSMIMWTLLRTVQTADYATYMGWAIPIIAKMFAPQGNPPAPPQ